MLHNDQNPVTAIWVVRNPHGTVLGASVRSARMALNDMTTVSLHALGGLFYDLLDRTNDAHRDRDRHEVQGYTITREVLPVLSAPVIGTGDGIALPSMPIERDTFNDDDYEASDAVTGAGDR